MHGFMLLVPNTGNGDRLCGRSYERFSHGESDLSKTLSFVVIFVMLICSGSVWGQTFSEDDTLSIPSGIGEPGDVILVPIDLVNTFMVGGFAVRISYDSSAFEPIAVDTTWRSASLELHGIDFQDPGIIRYFATSMRPLQNAMPPGSGPVAMMTIAIKNTAVDGFYDLVFTDENQTSYDNQLSDSLGLTLVIPIQVGGQIVVGDPTGIEDDKPLPESFALSQNFPNPFNQQTRISFSLASSGEVGLEIFDILGRKIATVFSGRADEGETVIGWDGRSAYGDDMPSGVYYYRLRTAGGESIVRKMTLLK